MIDALIYAVRDGIRAAGFGYGSESCEITADGRPPERCGNWFIAIHGGRDRSTGDNNLDERYEFLVTMTMRVTVPLDRVGDQQVARNIERVPLGVRQGFYAKRDQLRAYLHMNWPRVVLMGQQPNSANDNIAAWAGVPETYGFCEPMRYRGSDMPRLVGGEWFGADPEAEKFGVVSEMRFADARRIQPQTLPIGPFV